MRLALRSLLAAMSLLALIAASPDTFTRDELEALEAEKLAAVQQLSALENAGNLTVRETRNLESDLLSAAMESRRREQQATQSEKRLIELKTRLNAARGELVRDKGTLEDVLAALVASNRRQPPAMIVSPGHANDAIRRAILMSEATPRLTARANALSTEIKTLNMLERDIRRESARLDTAEAVLALKTAEIERLAAAKRAQYEDLSGEAQQLRQRVDILAKAAKNLRELLAALETHAPSPPRVKPARHKPDKPLTIAAVSPGRVAPSAPPVSKSLKPLGQSDLGGLGHPVSGLVVRKFGDKLPAGGKSEWLTIRTRANAQVLAPVSGRVEYAKPFRSYGQMLILRTSDGYNVILTGMSQIYASVGQTVKAGEPVGKMSGTKASEPELNVELRKGDRVLNPASWMKGGQ